MNLTLPLSVDKHIDILGFTTYEVRTHDGAFVCQTLFKSVAEGIVKALTK